MNLTIDFGNTLTKIGIFDNETLTDVIKHKTSELNFEIFEKILLKHNIENICFLKVAAVSEQILQFLYSLGKNVIYFDHSVNIPFETLYKPKQQLGLDRLAGVIGANYLYPNQNLLVIQLGTCITYDVYEKNIGHIGGAISPGIFIRNNGLATFTHQLKKIEINTMHHPLIGTNTEEALNSGILNCTIFEIETFINTVSEQYENILTILSGGDIIYFANKIKNKIFANQNITLIGLHKIISLNAKK